MADMWLVREIAEDGDDEACYLLYTEKPEPDRYRYWPDNEFAVFNDPIRFDYSTDLQLEPGGGPIKVRLVEVKQ